MHFCYHTGQEDGLFRTSFENEIGNVLPALKTIYHKFNTKATIRKLFLPLLCKKNTHFTRRPT